MMKSTTSLRAPSPAFEGVIIKQDRIGPIWNFLKEIVTERMFSEYESLYTTASNPDFIKLIDSGIWVDLEDVIQKASQKEPPSNAAAAPLEDQFSLSGFDPFGLNDGVLTFDDPSLYLFWEQPDNFPKTEV